MKRGKTLLASGLSLLLPAGMLITASTAGAAGVERAAPGPAGAAMSTCPWLNPRLPVQQRVDLLLPRMSLADKVDLMEGHNYYAPNGAIGYTDPIPSLCIPRVTQEDGPAGVADGVHGATQLPAPVNDAATWDPAQAAQYGKVLGAEEWAKGNDVVYGPTINIDRDPRWGRNFESLSEDPYLTGALAAPEIRGIQSQGPIAEVKHYAVYNVETHRNTPLDDDIVSRRAEHEIYLPAFHQAVTQGDPGAVMCSYSSPNGTYACQNAGLLSILEHRWGWNGFVGSDYGATHSTVASANAGLDQEQASSYYSALPAAVAAGKVSMATIDEAVTRILTQMFRFGLFNHQPTGTETTDASTPAHIAFAQDNSEQGTVLLRNQDGVLPLSPTGTSVAVIGADGTTKPLTAGGGSASVNPSQPVVTPLQAIEAKIGASNVTSYSGTDPAQAAATAAGAKVAIVFASNFESEGSDLPNITLQGNQDAYIEAVAKANPDTIVVLDTGGPVSMPWKDQVKGILEAWYPGQQDGAALAALLFGQVDPSGHLPETFPVSAAQTPTSSPSQFPGTDGKVLYSEGLDVGYRGYEAEGITPLYPFGYGLSYARFAYSHLRVTGDVTNPVSGPDSAAGQATTLLRVSATVTNTSRRYAGADVAQLYVGDPAAANEPPRQLKGFEKVFLRPGESKRVSFDLTGHDLSYWQKAADGWVLPDGAYRVYVGDSSALANLPLQGSFTVTRSEGARYATARASSSTVAPESTVTVDATFVNGGDYPMNDTHFSLAAPKGFASRLVGSAPTGLAPHQTATLTFDVAVPESAQDTTATLTPTVTYHQPRGDIPGAGHVAAWQRPSRGRLQLSSSTTVSVEPLATVALSPATVTVDPGHSATVTLTVTSHLPHPVTVSYSAAPPTGSGLTVTPSTGTLAVPPQGTSTTVTVAATTAAPGGASTIPLSLEAVDQGRDYPLPAAQLQATVPYTSVSAAYDDVGISGNADPSAGNFDGSGYSYSQQALNAVGLTPGAGVVQDGVTLTWPDVAAGKPDNVICEGQSIDLSGSGSRLVLLGAANNGTATGTLTVTYTDGSQQTQKISFADWYANAPATGDQLVATTSDWNQPSGGIGSHQVSVYSTAVPLQAGKTVASITLPDVSSGVGNGRNAMHVFTAGIG